MLTIEQTKVLLDIKSQQIEDLQHRLQCEQALRLQLLNQLHELWLQIKLNPVVYAPRLLIQLEQMIQENE